MPDGSMKFCTSNNNLRQIPDGEPELENTVASRGPDDEVALRAVHCAVDDGRYGGNRDGSSGKTPDSQASD